MHANTWPRPCVSSCVHMCTHVTSYISKCVRVCTTACACEREGVPLGLSAPRSESAKRLVTWSIHYIRTIASSNRHAPSLWFWRARSVCACVVLFCVCSNLFHEKRRGIYAISDTTKIDEIQQRSGKSPRSPLVTVGIIVCLRSLCPSIRDGTL